jgi:hypothetical protein
MILEENDEYRPLTEKEAEQHKDAQRMLDEARQMPHGESKFKIIKEAIEKITPIINSSDDTTTSSNKEKKNNNT